MLEVDGKGTDDSAEVCPSEEKGFILNTNSAINAWIGTSFPQIKVDFQAEAAIQWLGSLVQQRLCTAAGSRLFARRSANKFHSWNKYLLHSRCGIPHRRIDFDRD